MINTHSQEYEGMKQQRNHFEQLYEEHKTLLRKAKEENSSQLYSSVQNT